MMDLSTINHPQIRIWEINEDSTHYDKMVAAPTDNERRLMWILWATIMYVVVIFASIVFIGILSSRHARKNPFNTYLIFLMIPDIFMSLVCFITCTLNATAGYFYSPFACYFQSFYMVFGICANAWMNAIIAKELYALLRGAKEGRAFEPPSMKKVICDSIKVYIFSLFLASWGLIDKPWWPHKTGLLMGTACVPADYDTPSTIFFYAFFFPALMGIPLGYVGYVCYKIRKDDLMPRKGNRRLLTIYFLRLTAVFVVMWIPALFFLLIVAAWVPHWVVWAGGAWSHLQALVSAMMCLLKPDVANAVQRLICCRCSEDEHSSEEEDSTRSLSEAGEEIPTPARRTSSKKHLLTQKQHHHRGDSSDDTTRDNFNAKIPPDYSSDMSHLGTFSEIVGWKTKVEESEQERTPSTASMSQIGTFSEIVGWKTQVEPITEDYDEEHVKESKNKEEGTPIGSTSQIGTFSEIVGWKSHVEPIAGDDDEEFSENNQGNIIDCESSAQNFSHNDYGNKKAAKNLKLEEKISENSC